MIIQIGINNWNNNQMVNFYTNNPRKFQSGIFYIYFDIMCILCEFALIITNKLHMIKFIRRFKKDKRRQEANWSPDGRQRRNCNFCRTNC